MNFSLVTNAASKDAGRLKHFIPHWLRVFGDRLAEICVLVDPKPLEGRISDIHAVPPDLDAVRGVLRKLSTQHPKVRWRDLDYRALDLVSRTWWTSGRPVRCHAGSPIFAFAASIMEAKSQFVLRADCDMLFYDSGWVAEALAQLASDACDVVSPPRLGKLFPRFSSRAFMLDWPRFKTRNLPMKPARLDFLHSLPRWAFGQTSASGFEDTFVREIENGRIKHLLLTENFGRSIHVFFAEYADANNFSTVLARWEAGELPPAQLESGFDWNYCRDAWN